MKLKFKQQTYQKDAAQAVVDCFLGQSKGTREDIFNRSNDEQMEAFKTVFGNKKLELIDGEIFENILKVQKEQKIEPSRQFSGLDFTIEMETGTGKTYVYTKTIYELNKHYGWSKFIIMVPSIAIREGVNKSLEITAEHFQEIYGKKIRFYIYDSKKANNINNVRSFAESSSIEVIVMNYQAFASKSHEGRKIYQKLDELGSRKPIDIIKSTQPILIIDEPQKFGKQANTSIKEFNSLFKLRYSATHKKDEFFNKIYRLDSLEAYNQKLVKKIKVIGIEVLGTTGTNSYLFLDRINISKEKYPVAKLEFEEKRKGGLKKTARIVKEGDNLYELSGNLQQYEDFTVNEINALTNTISFTNGVELKVGQASGDINEKHLRRIQIREAIRSHLEKEKELFQRGIKVLTLFFIDEVAKYRQYDENNNDIKGEYAEIFEEEYNNEINNHIHLHDKEYAEYVNKFEVEKIHNGYFSIDKGKFTNSKEKRGEEGSDDASAYDLIMKDKEKLLSFEEPTKFIFSHSALREGWDNPNIFQICTLKHAQSEVSRKQEIGRGLRICVNKEGERMDSEILSEGFFETNSLTVIANESYEKFAKELQGEVLQSLSDRARQLLPKVFENKLVKDSEGKEHTITDAEAYKLVRFFQDNKYVDEENYVTDEFIEDAKNEKIVLPEIFEEYKEDILSIVKEAYSTDEFLNNLTENGRNNIDNFKITDNFHKREFQELWEKIKTKTMYQVDFDSNELISKSINAINSKLQVKRPRVSIVQGEQDEEELTRERLREGTMLTLRDNVTLNNTNVDDFDFGIKYDLVQEIMNRTFLTRQSVIKILSGLNEKTFSQYRQNPEDFIKQVSQYVADEKATTLINAVSYSKIKDQYTDDIFTDNNLKGTLGKNVIEVKRHVYDYLKYDANVEKKFAQDLESGEILVYAKLPTQFKILTPIGSYNPDWAIVFDKKDIKYIYFIAETKGSLESLELRGSEKMKIEYAKKHFKALGCEKIKYDVVDSYKTLLEIVSK